MQTKDIKVIEPGYYPKGAVALFIAGTWAILSQNEDDNFSVWYPGIDNEVELDKILEELPSGKHDTLGSGWCGSFIEMMNVLKAN